MLFKWCYFKTTPPLWLGCLCPCQLYLSQFQHPTLCSINNYFYWYICSLNNAIKLWNFNSLPHFDCANWMIMLNCVLRTRLNLSKYFVSELVWTAPSTVKNVIGCFLAELLAKAKSIQIFIKHCHKILF